MLTNQLYYLGPDGSYSSIGANYIQQLLSDHINYELNSCTNFRQIFDQDLLHNNLILIPIENSIGGNVSETLDLIWNYSKELVIYSEYILQISHCLISHASNASDITEIRAHNQALAQCQDYLQHNYPNAAQIQYTSNSIAVESLNQTENKSIAAIASINCSDLYNIPALDNNINDNINNFTRFWLMGMPHYTELLKSITAINHTYKNNQYLTSMAIRLKQDQPGSLAKILNYLAENNINLTKLFSRPHKGKLHEYTFYLDYISTNNTEHYTTINNNIAGMCSDYKILGHSYNVLPINDIRFR